MQTIGIRIPRRVAKLEISKVRTMAEPREDATIIQFTFGLDDPELEDEERLKFAKKLLPELRNLDEVERASRAEDLTPEAGSKPGFATLIGTLTAQVSFKNIKGFLGFLGDRFFLSLTFRTYS